MSELAAHILIADDHAVVRDGLRLLLTALPDTEVVGAEATAEHAVRAAVELRPDIVLMDLALPTMGGIAATRRIVADVPSARVLVLTTYTDSASIRAALEAGARGYVSKGSGIGELASALATVRSGGIALGAEIVATADEPQIADARPFPALTDSEFAVLELMAQGLSNEDIAARLHLSAKTVGNACTRVYVKLGVARRTEAARVAHRAGVGL